MPFEMARKIYRGIRPIRDRHRDGARCKQHASDKLGSVGRAAHDCAIAVIGEDDRALEADAVGEVAAHTPALMNEYHGRAQSNTKTFWHDSLGQRYKLTGDLGRLDTDGYLWLSGRASDLIISGGYNVYAVDIEAALSEHPPFSRSRWSVRPLANGAKLQLPAFSFETEPRWTSRHSDNGQTRSSARFNA